MAPRAMLTHLDIWVRSTGWRRAGLSASGSPRRPGSIPTTFNKSAHHAGRALALDRSVAKSLQATGVTVDISCRCTDRGGRDAGVPLIGPHRRGPGGLLATAGCPPARAGTIDFGAERRARLRAGGFRRSMRPAYRDGTALVVSPAAAIRRGDRVVVKTRKGEVMAEELKRRTAKSIELRSLNPSHAERTLGADDVLWIARIMWAGQ